MAEESLYKEVLLDHFHHPRNKGDLAGADVVRRGSNPRCGDEIEVGIEVEAGRLSRVRFRGRGCSVCIASASLMTEAVTGRDAAEAQALAERCGAGSPGMRPKPSSRRRAWGHCPRCAPIRHGDAVCCCPGRH